VAVPPRELRATHKTRTIAFVMTTRTLVFIVMALAFSNVAVHAQGRVEFTNPVQMNTVQEVIDAVINFVVILSFPAVTALVLYGAFLMLTSAGDARKFQTGWKVVLYAAIGFTVILAGRGIGTLLLNTFK
jgi:hypothetical protein